MRCGLLGRSLGHSMSPQLHALLGDYAYDLCEREPEVLLPFLQTCDLRGLNVTVPYKQTVLPYCDVLSDCAREVGSVNTLLFEDGKIVGENTDVYGFSQMLDRFDVSGCGKKTLVLGSGGASKAVQYVLKGRGADVTVISRSGENNYVNLKTYTDADIIINATPVGMYPDNGAAPLDLTQFQRCDTVIDLIYNPSKTALLLQAESLGKRAINGLYMLCAQAKRASELFQNCSLPDSLTESAWDFLSRRMQNIVLVGMPGCGKTSVGELLAKKLGRPFYDSDSAFAERYGQSSADFLMQQGETEFRRRETRLLKELCKQTGCVIATGGGVVTVPENRPILKQNGTVVYLQRELGELSVQGRPLSQSCGVEVLAARRLPLYQSWSDVTVNENSPQAAADKIREVRGL